MLAESRLDPAQTLQCIALVVEGTNITRRTLEGRVVGGNGSLIAVQGVLMLAESRLKLAKFCQHGSLAVEGINVIGHPQKGSLVSGNGITITGLGAVVARKCLVIIASELRHQRLLKIGFDHHLPAHFQQPGAYSVATGI